MPSSSRVWAALPVAACVLCVWRLLWLRNGATAVQEGLVPSVAAPALSGEYPSSPFSPPDLPGNSIYRLKATRIDGSAAHLGQFLGRVTLVVNVASK